ncbi:ketopantoate reductase family protein [Mesobacillus maritimus]|uniref:2-dehydropantoate 2-reductase n=1 Tax=Mesobacillus maritimus TaxID=1643336 RepID=A0ABS7K9I5_9BACI|nr:ketopantoate reductase family protein [Mesobacillus maritimus]MBY0098909.1 ketopantoate reductase family protein [Mesobacillus maritimus]
MRVLIVGAGGIGGYFGGRLVEKGEDVTFLVRQNRKQQLDETGLVIESVHGNMEFKPKTIVSGEPAEPFDVILLSTKAYHLQGAIEGMKPYVTENTMILPLLNGIAHVDELRAVFGDESVIGGLCFIETTLDEKGTVVQTSPIHDLVFGEFSGEQTERIKKLESTFQGTKASFRLSENIEQDMWHKYQFIATLSGVTSIFRAPIGPIRDQEYGVETIQTLLEEVGNVMRSVEAPLAEGIEASQMDKIMQMGYNMKSSLQRDMEKGLKTEAEHFFGYLLQIAKVKQLRTPVIGTIYANLEVYEAR